MSEAGPSGLLLVDKSPGWTSHDAVAAVRGLFPKGTKVGHCGTLDPMATGLLVLLVGAATKSAARLQGCDKVYSGRIRFGIETDTGDLDGRILREAPPPPIGARELEALFAGYLGELELPVPSYSAVKLKGKPLYAYARAGRETPVMLRRSRIYALRLLSWESPEAAFRLSCSSGTYVRAVAVRAGRDLGCPAALAALRRERVGEFSVESAVAVDALRALAREGASLLAGKLLADA